MAEEEVIAFTVQPSDHKRKLENAESEILDQHRVSIDCNKEASLDDGEDVSDFSQAKRPKLEYEASDGLGNEKTLESSSPTVKGKEDSGEKLHRDESEDKMDDESKPVDNNKPASLEPITSQEVAVEAVTSQEIAVEAVTSQEVAVEAVTSQEVAVEAVTSQEVSIEESKDVDTSGSQNEVVENGKETNEADTQEVVVNESKEVNDGYSKEANEDCSQKETHDENKDVVNGSDSHEELGDNTKEVNGDGLPQKEVDNTQTITRRIEVPSSKVGTLIGKGGEMVRHLQVTSGAKIQIRRDAEADPNSSLRPVELIGTFACVEKAEKLINGVIAESEAGGIPALAARGVPEQIEMKVPNDKVGVIIGRGGETIKNMQTKSRARIQLIPLEEGDGSKERTVRISGDKRQIDIATALIKDAMYQEARPPHYSGGYNQHGYQPRGPGGPPQWGPRGPHDPHSMPYNYHHGGPYPSQGSHYRPPNSGGYPPQHMPPRSGYGPGWEQRPPHSGPYDYYGRQGPQTPPSHAAPYSQTGPHQNYGPKYDQPNYDYPPMHQPYEGYRGSQQGYPPPAGGQHQMQQPNRPYGWQGPAEQGYGPPRPAPPSGDAPYQGPAQAAPPSYGTNMAPQQQYGYAASSAPPQQTYPPPYSSATPSDGYNGTQAPPATVPPYEQHGVQAASGVQQTPAGYGQVPPTGGYNSYPSTQPAYGNAPPAQSNGNYGYGSQYPSYGGGNASAYSGPAGQTGYSQTAPPAQAGYEQSTTQSASYAAAPGTTQ